MVEFPRGTVTFLFTDVYRSTELVKRLQEQYGAVLAQHRDLLRAAFAEHGGIEVDTQGDAFFVAFGHARDAVEAAVAGQRALADHRWPADAPLVVRVGLHTGEPHLAERGYTGVAVHRAARICTIAHGGQVLLSRSTAGIVNDSEIPGIGIRDLGEYRLKDFDRPERIFQLVVEGLPSEFPPPRTIDQQTPLSGTVTIVMTEGRRMMRLARELPAEQFGALLSKYQRLLRSLLEEMGGREVEVVGDSAVGAFASAKQAALAAAAAQRAVAANEWPHGLRPAISVASVSSVVRRGLRLVGRTRSAALCQTAQRSAHAHLRHASLGQSHASA